MLDVVQLCALLAVMAGVALTVSVGVALIVNGAIVLAAALAVERKVGA